jgi:hypothetical protein
MGPSILRPLITRNDFGIGNSPSWSGALPGTRHHLFSGVRLQGSKEEASRYRFQSSAQDLMPAACCLHPNARAMTPMTIAAAAMRRRVESPSESKRDPMAAPMRMEISRAGAT